jgi:hypothetical protein
MLFLPFIIKFNKKNRKYKKLFLIKLKIKWHLELKVFENILNLLKFSFFLIYFLFFYPIQVDPECIEAYNNFKLGKKEAFILFGFSNDKEKLRIIVLHKEPKIAHANDTARAKSKLKYKF